MWWGRYAGGAFVLGLAIGLQVLAGSADVCAMTLAALAVWVAIVHVDARRWREALPLAVGGALVGSPEALKLLLPNLSEGVDLELVELFAPQGLGLGFQILGAFCNDFIQNLACAVIVAHIQVRTRQVQLGGQGVAVSSDNQFLILVTERTFNGKITGQVQIIFFAGRTIASQVLRSPSSGSSSST